MVIVICTVAPGAPDDRPQRQTDHHRIAGDPRNPPTCPGNVPGGLLPDPRKGRPRPQAHGRLRAVSETVSANPGDAFIIYAEIPKRYSIFTNSAGHAKGGKR